MPVSAGQMLAAALELKKADRALWRLSPRWIRALFRPWWKAGWCNADVLHALGHAPAVGGSRRIDRCPPEQLRRPDGWVRHRMRLWWTDTGPAPAPRVWEQVQQQVARTHGAAAARRLPYGAAQLDPQHLTVSQAERDAAAAQLVRQWARELHEQRNAPPPPEQIPDEATRRRRWDEVCARIHRRPADRHASTAPETTAETTAAQDTPPTAQTAYERALERARREGHAPRPRRRRR